MKLLASDYDGTFCLNYLNVANDNIEAVKSFREAGNRFGFVTGRDYLSIKEIVDREGIEIDFLICSNGGQIFNNQFEVIYERRIEENLEELKNYLDEHVISYIMFGHRKYYYAHHWTSANIPMQLLSVHHRRKAKKLNRVLIKNIHDFYDDLPHQVSCVTKSNEEAVRIANLINKAFDHCYAMANQSHIDIVPKGVNKGEGVAFIRRYLEVSKSNTYVIGDNYNDLDMLSRYQSFAINSGVEKAKAMADYQVATVKDAITQLMNLKK